MSVSKKCTFCYLLEVNVSIYSTLKSVNFVKAKSEAYLAQLLALVVRKESAKGLETGVDTLHTAAFIRVGDLPADTFLLFHTAGYRVRLVDPSVHWRIRPLGR